MGIRVGNKCFERGVVDSSAVPRHVILGLEMGLSDLI